MMAVTGCTRKRPSEPWPLRDGEFRLFQKLIYHEAGIRLSAAKRALLVGRLGRRLRTLGCRSFQEYYDHVTSGCDGELATMLDCVCTNETRFFREPEQFRFLSERLLPAWRTAAAAGRRRRRIRLWSAACSTGEEPFSLAMAMLDQLRLEVGWDIHVLATDLSRWALGRAEMAVWPIERAVEIPERYRKRFMRRGTRSQEGRMQAAPILREIVEFRRLNLNDESYLGVGEFDAIFCRNVLIYFDGASRQRVIHRLLRHLEPSGFLFLGHAETLTGVTDRLRSVVPNVYAAGGTGSLERLLSPAAGGQR